MTIPLDYFRGIRKKFDDAGIAIPALSRLPGATEAELSRTFEFAEVLGAKILVNGLTVTAAKRLAPLADRHKFTVGILGGSDARSRTPTRSRALGRSRRRCVSRRATACVSTSATPRQAAVMLTSSSRTTTTS